MADSSVRARKQAGTLQIAQRTIGGCSRDAPLAVTPLDLVQQHLNVHRRLHLKDDPRGQLRLAAGRGTVTFGMAETADVRGRLEQGQLRLVTPLDAFAVTLQVPGEHNARNAIAACAASLISGGAGKSGKPCDRLTAPCRLASVARPGTGHGRPGVASLRLRLHAHRVPPVFEVAVHDGQGDRGPEGEPVPNPSRENDPILLDLHPPTATISPLPSLQITIDELDVYGHACGQTFNYRDECATVRFSGSGET